MNMCVRLLKGALLVSLLFVGQACSTGGGGGAGVSGNEDGSAPINDMESNEYKKAIVRCYKTGGTRVVKIMGQLRCY